MEYIITGFSNILTPLTLIWLTVGVSLGYLVGAMPGLGKAIAISIAIPFTFYLPPVTAIGLLIGIAKGSAAGSAVSAILLNVPGEPSSAPTAMDGYPLTRQGKAKKALKMGLFASVLGDLFATIVLIILAAPLARYALLIGPVELCAILFFSLTLIGSLASDSLLKGLIAGAFGVLLSTIGIETETFVPRLTFGFLELEDGLSLIPIAIGMLALAEIVLQAGNASQLDPQSTSAGSDDDPENRIITKDEWRRCLPTILRGSTIGTVVGILPGLGPSVASFMSYGAARKISATPEQFGKGMIEGVAAAESADNAVVPASFVPMFALGIPGSVIAAILISALILHGLTPGPRMFVEQPQLVADIYASMLVAGGILLVVGYAGQGLFIKLIRVPIRFMVPVVIFLCCIGAYMQTNSLFSIYVMLIFAVFGIFFRKLGYSFVTFLIGFVIGPNLELTFRQSLQLLGHDIEKLTGHPIAILFILLAVVTIIVTVRSHSLHKKRQHLATDAGSNNEQ